MSPRNEREKSSFIYCITNFAEEYTFINNTTHFPWETQPSFINNRLICRCVQGKRHDRYRGIFKKEKRRKNGTQGGEWKPLFAKRQKLRAI